MNRIPATKTLEHIQNLNTQVADRQLTLEHLYFRCTDCTEKREQVTELTHDMQTWLLTIPECIEIYTEDRDASGLIKIAHTRAQFTAQLRYWMQQWQVHDQYCVIDNNHAHTLRTLAITVHDELIHIANEPITPNNPQLEIEQSCIVLAEMKREYNALIRQLLTAPINSFQRITTSIAITLATAGLSVAASTGIASTIGSYFIEWRTSNKKTANYQEMENYIFNRLRQHRPHYAQCIQVALLNAGLDERLEELLDID